VQVVNLKFQKGKFKTSAVLDSKFKNAAIKDDEQAVDLKFQRGKFKTSVIFRRKFKNTFIQYGGRPPVGVILSANVTVRLRSPAAM
jgi:hypothetical protein